MIWAESLDVQFLVWSLWLFSVSLRNSKARQKAPLTDTILVEIFREGAAADGERATRSDMSRRRDNVVPRLWYVIMIMTCFLCALMFVDILTWGKKKLTAKPTTFSRL